MACQLLAWDTAFFGRRIARVSSDRLDAASAAAVNAWCLAHEIDCLYFLADPNDPFTIRQAEADQYHLVDVRVTLRMPLLEAEPQAAPPATPTIGTVINSEIDALRHIAEVSHRDSRFYYDLNFRRDDCDRLYATWIEKSCRENPAGVLVARCEGQAVGYIACEAAPHGEGHVTLLAVAGQAQGRGLGSALVRAGLGWCAAVGARSVQVVTQGRNIRALRLYEHLGFRAERMQFWYHRWFAAHTATGGT